MTPTLKAAFERLEHATPDVQERIAQTIFMTIGEDGRDKYADFVQGRLKQADREIDAGLGRPAQDVFADIHQEMKAKYGAV